MEYPLDVFKGAAEYYTRFRPAYPGQLFDDIIQNFSLDKYGVLLDLGCGTGEMTLPLAQYFEHTYAWDPDPDMIRLGRQKAQDARTNSIVFEQKSSHDIKTLTDTLRLVTMGQSFHWMDKPVVLRQLCGRLQQDGGMVIVSGRNGIRDTPQNALTSKKNAAVQEIITRYLGPKRRAGNTFYAPRDEKFQDLIVQAGFHGVTEVFYEYEITRSTDEIVGNLFSMSWATKAQFGEKAAAFEAEVRAALQILSPSGQFEEKIRFSCIMAKKLG